MKTVMDPQELLEFVKNVSDVTQHIHNANRSITTEHQELEAFWDDDQGSRFAKLFEEAEEEVARATERVERFCDLLSRKAKEQQNGLDVV